MVRRMAVIGLAVMAGLSMVVWAFVSAQQQQQQQEQQPAPTFRHVADVEFDRVGDEVLQLDLALPITEEKEGLFPVVVCLHGGGWVGGSRKQMTQTIEVLARRGYVGASPDYRLAPKHRFPACIDDCKRAIRWLRANAGRYRLDPNRIGCMGLSAGGHLACLLGVADDADDAAPSSKVQAVVSFSGPTDLTSEVLWTKENVTRNLEPLLGGHPHNKLDLCRQASPVSCVLRSPLPPFLLVHGSADTSVPIAQAQALADRLRQAGGKVRVRELPGEGHTWAGAALRRSIGEMMAFFDETLK